MNWFIVIFVQAVNYPNDKLEQADKTLPEEATDEKSENNCLE